MKTLSEELASRRHEIEKHLWLGPGRWETLHAAIEETEQDASIDLTDEQVWPFLLGCGYALAGDKGVAALSEALTGSASTQGGTSRIYFEAFPTAPREGEEDVLVDLAVGTIDETGNGNGSIELAASKNTWVCFCLAKWRTDITTGAGSDIHRNQLARIIESALCFQKSRTYADKVYVSLVTPSAFCDVRHRSRLYQYKFVEYQASQITLVSELNTCTTRRKNQPDWIYPHGLNERLKSISLRWVTFGELFRSMPGTALSSYLREYWRDFGSCLWRPVVHNTHLWSDLVTRTLDEVKSERSDDALSG